jgi:hypothetical protein
MVDAVLNRLLNLKVAKDRKGMAPNKPLLGPNTGSGRTFGVLNQKPTNKREIWFRLRVGTA